MGTVLGDIEACLVSAFCNINIYNIYGKICSIPEISDKHFLNSSLDNQNFV